MKSRPVENWRVWFPNKSEIQIISYTVVRFPQLYTSKKSGAALPKRDQSSLKKCARLFSLSRRNEIEDQQSCTYPSWVHIGYEFQSAIMESGSHRERMLKLFYCFKRIRCDANLRMRFALLGN